MNPNASPEPVLIYIDYLANPPGQVGARPRRIALNGKIRFNRKNEGTLTIEFIGESPLENGATVVVVEPGQDLTVTKTGRFPYRCILVRPDGTRAIAEPATAAGGGEIEVRSGG